jgi:hypothetical protein
MSPHYAAPAPHRALAFGNTGGRKSSPIGDECQWLMMHWFTTLINCCAATPDHAVQQSMVSCTG